MADISKLKIEGTVYEIKDSVARASDEVYSKSEPTDQEVGAFWSEILDD